MDPNWSFHNSDHHHQHPLMKTTNPPYNEQQLMKPSNLLQQQLKNFWERQHLESEEAIDFKNQSLPLARIKKIMKSDDNVHMISSDGPVLLAKACEMFIQDLTLRSWSCTEESKRKTLQKSDISAALSTTDLFDFLVDIVPREKGTNSLATVPSMMPMMNHSTTTPSVPFNLPLKATLCEGKCRFQEQIERDKGSSRVFPMDNVGVGPTPTPTPNMGSVGLHYHEGYNNYNVGEGAGLTMGVQSSQAQMQCDHQLDHSNEFIQGSWANCLSHQPAWPPPEF